MNTRYFKAPWCSALIVVSILATALCAGITLWYHPWKATHFHEQLPWLPLVIALGCALYTVRGYTITPDAILVHRLFWDTRLPRAGLQSASVDPQAMCRSIRTFGNGGFFSITGCYRNKTLGSYRALVTDPRLAVVLKFARRTIVVSPDAPEEFVHELGMAT